MALRSSMLKVISGEDQSVRAGFLRGVLAVAEPFYKAGVMASPGGVGFLSARPKVLGRPTVCVGNLTTGGTGKTPMVGHVVRRLAERGHKPCILMRGYRGGDEAEEHRRLLGEIAYVEPNPDRVAAAKLALGEHPDITCFVLDDGFQHLRAKRDLDLVLIDATNPWGYGHLLPRGLMREPKSALKRADAVIVTRSNQVDADTLAQIDTEVRLLTGRPPSAHAEHVWSGLRDSQDIYHPLTTICGAPVMGVVGIGNPASFEATLKSHAGSVVHCEALPDHHGYTRPELLRLIDLATIAGAQAIVTTEKDWVKWSVLLEDETIELPIYRAVLEMRFRDGETAVDVLLSERMPDPV